MNHLLEPLYALLERLGILDPCVIRVARTAIGLGYGDPAFTAITHPYWSKGYGTTCAVFANWVFSRCGVPEKYLNRGSAYIPGHQVQNLIEYAKKKGAYVQSPHPSTLKKGDYFYVHQPGEPAHWHVGFVEKNEWPVRLISIDGGQTNAHGEQSINRVVRPYTGELIGPYIPRQLFFKINTNSLIY